jgi:hypothetical protein
MLRSSSILLLFCAISLTQCAPYRAAWNSGWTEKEANNSIMLVIDTPPTLGWKRLQNYSTLHPEFQGFLEPLGTPDCIAESTQDHRHYLILYYLKKREAYSIRNDTRTRSKPLEVSGPYPITDKEYRLLGDFQKKALRSLEKTS